MVREFWIYSWHQALPENGGAIVCKTGRKTQQQLLAEVQEETIRGVCGPTPLSVFSSSRPPPSPLPSSYSFSFIVVR